MKKTSANHVSQSDAFYTVKLKMEKMLQKSGSVPVASKKSKISLQVHHAVHE